MHCLLPKMAHDRCPRNRQVMLSANKLRQERFSVRQLRSHLETFIGNSRDGGCSGAACEHRETVATTEHLPQEAKIWQACRPSQSQARKFATQKALSHYRKRLLTGVTTPCRARRRAHRDQAW